MGQIGRYVFGVKMTIGMAFATLIHYRLGVNHLYPLATNEFAGPFSSNVDMLKVAVPVVIGVILVATWVWVIISPVQEEQAVRRRVRR